MNGPWALPSQPSPTASFPCRTRSASRNPGKPHKSFHEALRDGLRAKAALSAGDGDSGTPGSARNRSLRPPGLHPLEGSSQNPNSSQLIL